MKRLLFILPLFLSYTISFGQSNNTLPITNALIEKEIKAIQTDQKISADSAYSILSNWNKYPTIKEVKKWYLFLYKDPIFGTVPLKIYIPENYKSNIASPAILILHGAVGGSTFNDAYKNTIADEEIYYKYFAEKNFVVIRPFADRDKNFNWVANRFNSKNSPNPTFQTLTNCIMQLKKTINIDDNRLFALGHSDGSDGAFALELYAPSLFAGFIGYNSMLTTIFSHDMYLRNTLNRSLYLVHSSLDDLRPIEQTRLIVKKLDSLQSPILYKEYLGYQHFDKHLDIDLPYGYEWISGISRNPFQKNITWEMSESMYKTCDWINILKFDTTLKKSEWLTELNTKSYDKRNKIYANVNYYDLNKSVAIKASFNNNTFFISTSGIKEFEVFISPVMVNLQNPVIIKVNDKEVFNKKVTANKMFLLNNFSLTSDKKAVWIASVKIKSD